MRWVESFAPTAANAAFWDGLREGRVLASHCGDCGAWAFYPRAICPTCGALAPALEPLAGSGTVYSVTVVRRSPFDDLAEAPYGVALVDMDEGVRLLGRVVDGAASIGERVRLRIVDTEPDGPVWWVFAPEDHAAEEGG